MTGFTEVRWDDEERRVVYEPVQLQQEYRNFDYLSPWEGSQYVLPGDEKGAPESAPGPASVPAENKKAGPKG